MGFLDWINVFIAILIFAITLYYNFIVLVPKKLSNLLELQVNIVEIKYRLEEFEDEFKNLLFSQDDFFNNPKYKIKFKGQEEYLMMALIQVKADAVEVDKKTYQSVKSLIEKHSNLTEPRFNFEIIENEDDMFSQADENMRTIFNLENSYIQLINELGTILELIRERIKFYEEQLF